MTYTGMVFSLKSGFKKIVLTQKLILVLNQVSRKYCLHRISLYKMQTIIFHQNLPEVLCGDTKIYRGKTGVGIIFVKPDLRLKSTPV